MLKPVRGTVLNYNHPLVQGLVGCWVLNEYTGVLINDLSGQHNNGAIEGATWIPNGLDFITDDYANVGHNAILNLDDAVTIIARIKLTATPSTGDKIFAKGDTAYCIDLNNSRLLRMTIYDTTWRLTASITALTVGTIHDIGGSFSTDSDDSKIRIYLDGVDDNPGTSATATGINDSASKDGYIGGNCDAGGQRFDGEIYHLYVYNRRLTTNEVSYLHSEPYDIFRSFNPVRYFYVGGNQYYKDMTGGLTIAGLIAKRGIHIKRIGSLSLSGDINKSVSIAKFGNVSTSGDVIRSISTIKYGTVNASATLDTVLVALKSVAGIITSSGDLSAIVIFKQFLAGTISSIGSLSAYISNKCIFAVISIAGLLKRIVNKKVFGSLNSSGLVGRLYMPGGSVPKKLGRVIGSALRYILGGV